MRIACLLPLLPLLVAAAPGPTAGTAPGATAPGAGMVSFTVTDERDPFEISEDTVLFIGGRQVAHFMLDAGHETQTRSVTIPAAPQYEYALCGRITITRPDGTHEQHVVDGGATLKSINGHALRALAAGDFTIFYLAEASDDNPMPPRDAHHTNACSLPVV